MIGDTFKTYIVKFVTSLTLLKSFMTLMLYNTQCNYLLSPVFLK